MYSAEFKMGGKIEEMRLRSIRQINEEAVDIKQDKQDLKDLKFLYECLPISDKDRAIIDDYIFCIRSREQRMESYIYYAGMMDSVNL